MSGKRKTSGTKNQKSNSPARKKQRANEASPSPPPSRNNNHNKNTKKKQNEELEEKNQQMMNIITVDKVRSTRNVQSEFKLRTKIIAMEMKKFINRKTNKPFKILTIISGDSTGIIAAKYSDQKAQEMQQKSEIGREVILEFKSSHIRSHFNKKYNNTTTPLLLQDAICTTTPNEIIDELYFPSEKLEKSNNITRKCKINIAGIVTNKELKTFGKTEGFELCIGDETANIKYPIFDKQRFEKEYQMNEKEIVVGSVFFVANANCQKNQKWTNISNGIILNQAHLQVGNLSGIKKELEKKYANGEIKLAAPKIDLDTFIQCTVYRIETLIDEFEQDKEETVEWKAKYDGIQCDLFVEQFVDTMDMTYKHLKTDSKRKKLDEQDLAEIDDNEIQSSWKIKVEVADEDDDSMSLYVFGDAGTQLMGCTADIFLSKTMQQQEDIIDGIEGQEKHWFISYWVDKYKGKRKIRSNVIKID